MHSDESVRIAWVAERLVRKKCKREYEAAIMMASSDLMARIDKRPDKRTSDIFDEYVDHLEKVLSMAEEDLKPLWPWQTLIKATRDIQIHM